MDRAQSTEKPSGECVSMSDNRNMRNKQVGRFGENCAVDYLVSIGYRIAERNYRCEHGEIDIVAYDGDVLVFAEVKTRRSRRFGEPCEAVGIKKQQTIYDCATRYTIDNDTECEVRFDVIEVIYSDSGKGFAADEVNHIRRAFC